jgi:NaMN:DMB phosphoribosyltransferase
MRHVSPKKGVRNFRALKTPALIGALRVPDTFFWAMSVLLVVWLVGCGESQPTMIHGRSVAYWLQALQDRDARLRKKAVEALGNVGSADAAVVPALIQAARDPDGGVRDAAVLALFKIAPDAPEAIPALQAAQKDKDTKVRKHAEKALERIQGDQ